MSTQTPLPPARVAVHGHLRFPPERVPDILPHLRTLAEATRQNDGCIAYEVALDPFDRGVIRFSELWPDQQTFSQHVLAPHVGPWRAAVQSCGLLERQFTVYDITGARSA